MLLLPVRPKKGNPFSLFRFRLLPKNAIDYDPNFRLYLITKLSNPHYLPDVCIKCTIVNFTSEEALVSIQSWQLLLNV